MVNFSLQGKRALVTGSSRGIGRAIAMAYGEAGAKVFFHGSGPSARLDETIAEARAKNIECKAVTADISKVEEIEQLMNKTLPLDILVLNVSVQKYMTLENFDLEEYQREMDINLRSAFLMLKPALAVMCEQQFGRIISIGSINQMRPAARLTVYAAAKSALHNLILNCAREYAPYGITANTIVPGIIPTDRNTEVLKDPALVKELLAEVPAGRFGTVEDCAGIAVLLASEAGSYITGAEIPVAGGMQL